MQAGLLSRERSTSRGAEGVVLPEGNTASPDKARESGPGAVGDPEHAWKLLAREPGDPVTALEEMAAGAAAGSLRTQSADERSREV